MELPKKRTRENEPEIDGQTELEADATATDKMEPARELAPRKTTATAAAPERVPYRRASEILAEHLGLDPKTMIETVKAQCFKGVNPSAVTNEQLAAFVNVANSLASQCPGFNPLLPGMLYAYPTKSGGIEPMIGPDGVFALLNAMPDVLGWETVPEFDESGELVSAVAKIIVRGKEPFRKRVFLNEWKMESNLNWKIRPIHMLELRALKQCARYVIHGIPLDAEDIAIAAQAEVRADRGPDALRGRLLIEPKNGECEP